MVGGRREVSKDAGPVVLRHENAVLRGPIGRVRYRPGGRLWRAARSGLIPRRGRAEVFAVTPATLLGWHRRLVAGRRDDAGRRRPGRPCTAAAIGTLVTGMAVDNPARGRRRGPGELITPGRQIAASAVRQILHDAGINPAPRRPGPAWGPFLTAHARGIRAAGLVPADTVPLRRIYAVIIFGHGTGRAHLAGVTARPGRSRTTQAARHVLTDPGQRAASVKVLITDRAGQFTESFDAVSAADGTTILPSPPQPPTADAAGEPMTATLRRELSGRLPILTQHHLRRARTGYLTHDHTARPHRTPGQLPPAHAHARLPQIDLAGYRVRRKQVPGGLTHQYQIAA
jgi:putative transposase